MWLYQNCNNKRKNFTVSCIQICFNASKDIQRVDGHSKLGFIDVKTNITSILLSLHRFDKTVVGEKQKHRQTNLQNETLRKTTAALLLVLEIYKKIFVCLAESKKLDASQWETELKVHKQFLSHLKRKGFKSHICKFAQGNKVCL